MFQVKKNVNKLVNRDALNYRKITDKPRTKDEKKEEAPVVEETPATTESSEVKMETDQNETPAVPETPDDETLALGEYGGVKLLKKLPMLYWTSISVKTSHVLLWALLV